ncbi:hypothetical protein N7481_000011 [Penicillium waksmanii]|uniref:uncharacterized protein n=1 Tax=Penicillium waksmanii TaxID=69791 RepID=UPI0025471B7E|nr:uncharacterized protein N7481_000011 [Penicillium waksmanii]KAJ5999602.1 hypothetical protein N7481_000011 [Penicillium waksmanii]
MSILALYLRLFPNKSLRISVFTCMGFLSVSVLILIPMVIWQCNPIYASWQLDARNHARCLSISGVAYANAAINIATELTIVAIPLPVLRKLQVKRGKAISLYVLFGAGLLVIGIASARVMSLKNIATLNDPTYTNVPVTLWTCAESAVVHICATAPAIRYLFTRAIQLLRGLGTGRTSKPTTWGFKPSGRQGGSANIGLPTSSSLTQLRHTEDIAKMTSSCGMSSCAWHNYEEPNAASARNIEDVALMITATPKDEEQQTDFALKPLPRPPRSHLSSSSRYSEGEFRDMDIDGDQVTIMKLAGEDCERLCSLGNCTCAQRAGFGRQGRWFLDV